MLLATKSFSNPSEVARLSSVDQHHSGSGDNVGRDKIYVEIKSLAPADLVVPMEMVFESLRKNDRAKAKIQMAVLKSIAQRDPEAAALVEVISIYGGLVEAEDHSAAWGTVSKITASAQNDIIKDVCLAALLRLSRNTEREEAAKEHYLAEPAPGLYARETFLRSYADQGEIEAAGRQFILSEGELTGVVEGALRLELTGRAVLMAKRLNEDFESDNAKVLQVMANACEINPDLAQPHFWLNLPEVKQRLDELAAQVVRLLELSHGTDLRLYNMACPIFETYQGLAPPALYETLKKYLLYLGPNHSKTAARFKAIAGDDTDLTQRQRDLCAAKESPKKRTAWCRNFLTSSKSSLEEVIPFIHLATPGEISEWLSLETLIDDTSAMEVAFIRLFASSFRGAEQPEDLVQRNQLAEEVDAFVIEWADDIQNIAAERAFELAEKLFSAKLPHKALSITTRLVPDHALWPSPFVLEHLKFLLETQQYKTFDEVVSRVVGAETSLTLMSFQSLKAERMGEIDAAIKISDQMILQAPEVPHCWYRGCFLRDRYLSEAEQREFQQRIPDSLLQNPSSEVVAILYFLTRSGNFKRAESRWVEWFIQDPRGHAIELVNFHFGLSSGRQYQFDVSLTLEQCTAAIQFEQDASTMIRLIVDDQHGSSECTLKASSQLAKLLLRLPIDESADLGMTSYKVKEHLAPYVACVRIALRLRHDHNDGSDCFAMLQMPSDKAQLIPYLEKKLNQSAETRAQLGMVDAIPLSMRGHALYPDSAFKGALNCWTDVNFPKSPLFALGDAQPSSVVLDAYGIGYLAVTDLAQRLLDIGMSFVLPAATKEALTLFLAEISDESFMLLGLTSSGNLSRTTASDLRARDGHTLKALRLILGTAVVVHPVVHDALLDLYSVKEGVDLTVYDAMQLSVANKVPWFCMDGAFASLHHSSGHETANVQAIIVRAMASSPFDFEHKRHGFLLYALGALPLPLTFSDIHYLAATPNALAGFILFKIIQNQGRHIFAGDERQLFLLDTIVVNLKSWFQSGRSPDALRPLYTPWTPFSAHAFNHGISLYLDSGNPGTIESRLAVAMMYMALKSGPNQRFTEFLCAHFVGFAEGHFMDVKGIRMNLQSLVKQRSGVGQAGADVGQ